MSPLSLEGIETSQHLREVLDARFREAVQYSHDYETVFVPDENDLGYAIPFLSTLAPRDWARLVRRIEEFDFSSLDFDVIGQMYERLISGSERRRFGQFYTSPDVVDLINDFCIRGPDDRVLDPACGGGTFLVRAYSRKRALAQSADESPLSHERLLADIFGIDIAAFPAQLSTINLAVRHLSDEAIYPRVARASFFDAQAGIPLYDIPLSGDSMRSIALKEVDAVVGNPPYIRQEEIGRTDKASYAELFRKEWPGQTKLSGRSDIYAYFFATPPACSSPTVTWDSSPASAGWTPSTASGSRSSSCATSASSPSSSPRWRSGSRTPASPPPSPSSSASRTPRSGTATPSASSSSESPWPKSTPKPWTDPSAKRARPRARPTWTPYAT